VQIFQPLARYFFSTLQGESCEPVAGDVTHLCCCADCCEKEKRKQAKMSHTDSPRRPLSVDNLGAHNRSLTPRGAPSPLQPAKPVSAARTNPHRKPKLTIGPSTADVASVGSAEVQRLIAAELALLRSIADGTASEAATSRTVSTATTRASRMTSTTQSSNYSTDSKRYRAAIYHAHVLLSQQLSVLRKIFRMVDVDRQGIAPRDVLRAEIIDKLRVHPQWRPGVDALLDLVDPLGTGQIEFGRLTRVLRTAPSLGAGSAAGSDAGNDVVRSANDDDNDLRACFAGVNTGDRTVVKRLADLRQIPKMSAGTRTSNILGDANVRAPWATVGDDERMNHLIAILHDERGADLLETLMAHASPHGMLTYAQLIAALREFDPFVHDAEVIQYFTTMVHAKSGTTGNAEVLLSAEGLECGGAGTGEHGALHTAKMQRASVSAVDFLRRFGTNVLTSPAMRSSATFSIKWNLPPPVPAARAVIPLAKANPNAASQGPHAPTVANYQTKHEKVKPAVPVSAKKLQLTNKQAADRATEKLSRLKVLGAQGPATVLPFGGVTGGLAADAASAGLPIYPQSSAVKPATPRPAPRRAVVEGNYLVAKRPSSALSSTSSRQRAQMQAAVGAPRS
jgi:hypothetical protein